MEFARGTLSMVGENMSDDPQRPEPRSFTAVFADLKDLAQSEGALHEISGLVYRDWVITYDQRDGRVTNDLEYRWSTSRLNKNELMLLVGLMVQSPSHHTYSTVVFDGDFVERADTLLRELHDRILVDAIPAFDSNTRTFADGHDHVAPLAREAIYYGAENFYMHQLLKFTRVRYRNDATWLLQNAGVSIRPIIDITTFILNRINAQMSAIGHLREEGQTFGNGDLTNSLLIDKADLRKRFGSKVDAYIGKFATPITGANEGFTDPFAVNAVAISPLIDMGQHLYVANQFRLVESLYESPFYWMGLDKAYLNTLAAHRGAFLEQTTAQILRSVFGADHVFENVILYHGSKDRAGEIDVLVVYGEFVLIVQAKSKRVTMKARAGDLDALNADFKGAIQDPYEQALSCGNLIQSGARCISPDGKDVDLPHLPRTFPVVILSDPFPSSTLLSHSLLKRSPGGAPVIWDIGVLDCVARMLPAPIDLLFYLQCRAQVFETVMSDSEYNYLGYHIKAKLALPPDVDGMTLDRDFATVVDDFMLAADFGISVARPAGVLERLSIPVISELLQFLKHSDPRLSSIVVDLYDFSQTALEDLSKTILSVRNEVRRTRKAIKAFSILTGTGGITYAVTSDFSEATRTSAEMIGRKHKYDQCRERWYVIVDCVGTEVHVDGLLPLVYPWLEDGTEARNSEIVASIFNSTFQERRVGEGSFAEPQHQGYTPPPAQKRSAAHDADVTGETG